jgi:hypothetical protein
MEAIATDGRSAGRGISARVLRRTWEQPQSAQDVNFNGLQRDGYGLGWDLGSYDGERYVSRSGGYPGCRSIGFWLPGRKFTISILSGGDMASNPFNIAILMQAADLWRSRPDTRQRGEDRISGFRRAAAEAAAKLQKPDPRFAKASPLAATTARAGPGEYSNSRLGKFTITRGSRGLVATSGALVMDLVPLSDREFLAVQRGQFEPSKFEFLGNSEGGFARFIWDGDEFDRVQ